MRTKAIDRRQFFQRGIKLVTPILLALLALPSLLYGFWPLLRPRPGTRWVELGELEEFAVGQVTQAEVPHSEPLSWSTLPQKRGVYVWRKGEQEDDIVVYSRNCTDLSCPVHWDPSSQWFYCPCHGGVFDEEGKPRSGPPKLPLYRYDYQIKDGWVKIDLLSVPPVAR